MPKFPKVFNPEQALKETRQLHGAEGLQALQEYKDRYKKLKGVFMIESPLFFDKLEDSKAVETHERQHILNYFYAKLDFSDLKHSFQDFLNKKKGERLPHSYNKEKDDFNAMWLIDNPKIEKNIKDEIIAYFKQGVGSQNVSREFGRFEINTDTILVGHSCGGGFLLRWLSDKFPELLNVILP